MNQSYKYYFQVHLAVLLFGAVGLFGKLIQLSSGGIVLGRALLGAIFILGVSPIYTLYQNQKRATLPLDSFAKPKTALFEQFRPKTVKDLLFFGILGSILAFHWIAFFEAIQRSSVTIGVLTFSTFPIFTILFAPWFNKERLLFSDLVLAVIAFGGILLVMPSFSFEHQHTQGALWGVASGASFAILTLISQLMINGYSSNCVSFYQNGVAALILLPFFSADVLAGSSKDWFYLVLLGVIFTGIAHTMFINSMNGIKAQTASLITNLEPVYGILLAWLFLGETPHANVLLGGGLILAVAFFAMKKK
ncbi:DMT family transporter [Aureispira anguillae]|uniref:DMT family transporter n=1 Tax=Aureispira anguillae TaxID=2864201 RepID=A0A915YIQ5_9BACT|nr:DMT family transporter [Aureispira anguillae]BDS13823.1 DMT family transporter [Aureispira anguillae]